MSSSPLSSISSLSSPLSSVGSRSPSLPRDYPSPPLSNVSETGNTSRLREAQHDPDGPPPAKRQKVMKPRDMKTEHLDLLRLNESDSEEHHKAENHKLDRLADALRNKRKIVVIAGAGISVSAGIPDFRSGTGLFKTLRTQHNLKASGKHLFDADVYRNDTSTSSFHDMVRELSQLTSKATPTPFHNMLARLAKEGRLLRLYTQNVDGIDSGMPPLTTQVPLKSKGPWPKTVQLHGGLEKMVCSKCRKLYDFDGKLFDGPEAPACMECEEFDAVRVASGLRSHGIGRLRPRMVLYNEHNPDSEAIGAVSEADLKKGPDAVIVVGTSLKVPGIRRLAKEMCSVTRGRRNTFTAWINHDPEPTTPEFKDCWDMVVRGECDDVARLANLPLWDEEDVGTVPVNSEEGVVSSQLAVVLEQKMIAAVKTQGILTPMDSPRQQSPTPIGPPKMKQMSLPFGSASTAADIKVAKKRGRKPLPDGKPTKATSQITNAFKTSKASKVSIAISKKSTKTETGDSPSPNIFPGLQISPMRQLSPFDTRTNSDLPTSKDPETPKESQFVVEIPYNRHETISPKGRIPSGMADLLS